MKMRTRRRLCPRRTLMRWSSARLSIIQLREVVAEMAPLFERAAAFHFQEFILDAIEKGQLLEIPVGPTPSN